MTFVPHTDKDRAEMLAAIGVGSMDDLFADIPEGLRVKALNMGEGLSEQEVYDRLHEMSHRNAHSLISFLGGGFYDHIIPAAVDSLTSRGEFFTAYTPYQPEVSQGTLQAIFEYQSMICRLTGMDAANASMYDGGTALAEAVMMAVNVTGRDKVVMSAGVNPVYRLMIRSYTNNLGIRLMELPASPDGVIDRAAAAAALDGDTAALIVQNPDYFGTADDFTDLAQKTSGAGVLLIASVYPVSLGLLKRPGDMGADIVTGEGQSLGLPLSFGGPYLGFFAVRQALVRKMPGRIVGDTVDRRGKRCFVLTLQAREQHIRREKATSNICTNEALCALRATVFLSLLGRQGLREMAESCARKAAYAKRRLAQIKGLRVRNRAPTFNEFTIELPVEAGGVVCKLIDRGFAAGFPLGRYYPELGNCLLMALTEKRSKAEIDSFATALEVAL
ncbi:MAG: aminomethyl-transferring glycine dehydrogenase subunit GcvPA [Kiritimatiellae bacterium]|nr:aminomethyl-transferring glycine dehydrogenase subunit GcvPA [Kiritimatiellia bacterium]MDD4025639.1 aminomethyl-transferring glycine dehydrogenase subunit GcvPA [Kiritimatiellia bacterium]MDD4621780.1 aminomethyl-transferring glycine dehydrogenase subunit GcvPA [Kiritimatiellia bacterium]